MLLCTYPATAGDAWSRILDTLERHGMAGFVPRDPVRKVTGNTWTFETSIQGLTLEEELLLVISFSDDKDITAQQA